MIKSINIYLVMIISSLCLLPSGIAQPSSGPVIVNLMIDAYIKNAPTYEDGYEAQTFINSMYEEIDKRNLGATFFLTEDLTNTYARLRLTSVGLNPKFELALSGNSSNEKLSSKSYTEQKNILTAAKSGVESCNICGQNVITVRGFLPQLFDQNEDTYQVLDELDIKYDAGYQAGLLYSPGNKDKIWPYKLEGHKFYAVPVSTYSLSGKVVPIYDRYFNESGLSSSQWYDAMEGKFEESKDSNEPVVILLTTSISGAGDYLDSLKRFLDFAVSKDASFVTTIELVNMSLAEGDQPVTLATEVCTTCNQNKEAGNVANISVESGKFDIANCR